MATYPGSGGRAGGVRQRSVSGWPAEPPVAGPAPETTDGCRPRAGGPGTGQSIQGRRSGHAEGPGTGQSIQGCRSGHAEGPVMVSHYRDTDQDTGCWPEGHTDGAGICRGRVNIRPPAALALIVVRDVIMPGLASLHNKTSRYHIHWLPV